MVLAQGDRMLAVVWKKGDRDLRREVPAGDYTVRTTRIERMKGKQWWFVSSTGKTKLVVEKNKTTKFIADDAVQFRGNANVRDGKLQLGFGISGADKRGLSVYRDGKRVPVTYRLLDKNGKAVAKGTMNYG